MLALLYFNALSMAIVESQIFKIFPSNEICFTRLDSGERLLIFPRFGDFLLCHFFVCCFHDSKLIAISRRNAGILHYLPSA